jgi:pimeloyl-ACP methyl ester carboxylesterase
VFSYNIMKTRAGDIGRTGLGSLLARLHGRSPAVRVHLIGHSFGARLVAFALAGIDSPQQSPVASLVLVQGAFSHWSFAHKQDNPFGRAGALHTVADRAHGPLVATYSVYDWAVGVWYPKASFLSRQDTQAFVVSRWGGMGADGYQAVSPLEARTMPPADGTGYGFEPGKFYRVNAAGVINNVDGQPFAGAHSDIRKPEVARLVVDAAGAHT